MSICPRCGEDNAEGARFCSMCGAALTSPTAGVEVRKTVTVVFCDVANSTRLGEQLDPEAHRRVMGRYFEAMRRVLERHGGTVEKFIGDAVMAVFGIPLVHEDDALRAVRAATEMREVLAELNEELRRNWDLEIAMRTGVNTGEVVTGEPGAAQTLVTGDAVVVAKRLEETAAANEIQLGADTYRLVRDAVLAEPAGVRDAKGKPALAPWRLLAVVGRAEVTPLRLDSPLVGRDLDLAALEETYERAVADRACHLFAVLGAAGIGKSRLTHEFIQRLGNRAQVLRGRCLPYGDGITFWPLVEIVKQAARLTDADSPSAAQAKIAALLPPSDDAGLVCERIAAVVGRGEAPSARPEETFWAVRRLLEGLAGQRPVVVVLDDLQWAESTFLDLVEYVLGWSSGGPILICCLARPELIELRPSWIVPRPNSISAFLEPLDSAHTDQMMRNLLEAPLPGEVRARVAEAAQGNPLFVEEMLRMLRDEGLLELDNGGWRATGDLKDVAVSPTIHALLAARLDRLAPEERGLVQRASVAGQVFWWGAVAELSPDLERAGVGASLQTLVRKGLIRREPSAFAAEDAFRFGHILVRDAAYASLPKEARSDLHERLAEWLERKTGEGAAEYEEIVAYHLEQSFRYRAEIAAVDEQGRDLAMRAARHLASAGSRAFRRGDMPAAANLLDRAVELLPLESVERLKLLPELGRALRERGELARAEQALIAAARGASARHEPGLEAQARLEHAWLRLYTDPATSADEALKAAESARAVFESLDDQLGLARALRMAGIVYWFQARSHAMEEVLEQALVHAERADDPREQSLILGYLARAAFVGPRPAEEAIARCERILERAREDRLLDAEISALLGPLHAMCGRFDRARELYGRSTAVLEEFGRRMLVASNAIYSGYIELLAGDLAAAETQLRAAYDALLLMGERAQLSTVAAELARVLEVGHRFEEAQHLTVVSQQAAPSADALSQVAWRGVRARLLARRGAFEAAEAYARDGVRIAEETDFLDLRGLAQLDLASVLRRAGKAGEADAALRRAIEFWQAKGDVVMVERARQRLSEGAAVFTS